MMLIKVQEKRYINPVHIYSVRENGPFREDGPTEVVVLGADGTDIVFPGMTLDEFMDALQDGIKVKF